MLQMALQVLSPPKLALITDSAMIFKVLAISHCRALRAGSTAMALEASSRLESTLAGSTRRDLGNRRSTQSSSGQAPSSPLLPTLCHATLRDRWPIGTNCAHRPQSDQPGQRPSRDVGGRKTGGFVGDERRATAWVTDCHQAELGAQATPSVFAVPCTTVE